MSAPTNLSDEFAAIIERARRSSLENEDQTRATIAAEKLKARSERLSRMREILPPDDYERVLHGRLDSVAWQKVSKFVELFDAGVARFLVLVGTSGTSKTCACAGVIADRGGMHIEACELVRAYADRSYGAQQLRHAVRTAKVLLIDDIGVGDHQAEQRALYETVNGRQGGDRMTLITANVPRNTMGNWDARILGRIEKQGAIVEVGGEDQRRRRH